MTLPGLPSLTCQVCNGEPAVGVAAVPGVPVSMAYGRKCLEANAHPYDILVTATAVAVDTQPYAGYRDTPLAEEWKQMITDTLTYLGRSPERFDADVREAIAGWQRHEAAELLAQQTEHGKGAE